ncbi:MAG: hypothetical protein J0L84_15075, partial [Verrucomicrobia bacterium]|nr:hypothetical protein [Verrucomicrobiota bacterium]
MIGRAGDDMLDGGPGDDVVDGGGGDDRYFIALDAGHDIIKQSSAAVGDQDVIELAVGIVESDIRLFVDAYGGSYFLQIRGELAATINVDPSAPVLPGLRFADAKGWLSERWQEAGLMLSGTSMSDELYGASAADVLYGFDDWDWLEGGDGDDTLVGGRGDDGLAGGRGSDWYRFSPGDGDDVVYIDRGSGDDTDVIDLTEGFSAASMDVDAANGAIVLSFSGLADTVVLYAEADLRCLRAHTPSGPRRSISTPPVWWTCSCRKPAWTRSPCSSA